MNIVMINGQNHKGSTYQIAKKIIEKISIQYESLGTIELKEFFLPQDFDAFCLGCTTCFLKDEKKCPHYEKLTPITRAMDEADLLVFTSPVYVMHATGSMKVLLDHYGYRFMVHRPEQRMFKKQALCVSTAAGAGMKSTNKDIADSLFYWGVPKIYKYGVAVNAVKYEEIPERIMKKIEKKTTVIAKRIVTSNGKVKPGIKTKIMFEFIRLLTSAGWNKTDTVYWEEKGWSKNKRPWKA